MNSVVFHSFYTDRALGHLKQAVLYFDKVVIPGDSFLIADRQSLDSRWVQLLPDHATKDVKYLQERGAVEVRRVQDQSWQNTFSLIAGQLKETGFPRGEPGEGLEICRFLRVDPNRKISKEGAANLAVMVSALCIRQIQGELSSPCVDSRIVFDLINSGLSQVLHSERVHEVLVREGLASYKSRLIAQQLMHVTLPTFDLTSFDDILELRQTLRTDIDSFRNYLNEVSRAIPGVPWDPDFAHQIERTVRSLRREYSELQRELSFSAKHVVKKLFRSAVPTALVKAVYGDWPGALGAIFDAVSPSSVATAIRSEQSEMTARRDRSHLCFLLKAARSA